MNSFDDDRRVDDFFAAHRRAVVEQPADEVTWERIRRGARSGGGNRVGWFLGGAVAASALALAVLTSQLTGGGATQVTPAGGGASTTLDGASATPSQTAAPGIATAPDGSVVPAPDGTTVGGAGGPVTLGAPDLSGGVQRVMPPTGGEALRAATFTSRCSAGTCTGLAISTDTSATWAAAADLGRAGYASALAAGDTLWVWGDAGLARSSDAGRSWSRIPTRGERVLFVQADGAELTVVTAGCPGGSVTSCAEVVLTDVGTDDARDGRRVVTLTDLPRGGFAEPVATGGVDHTQDAVYVRLEDKDVVYRVSRSDEPSVRIPTEGCRVSASPGSADTLVSWCAAQGTLARSTDGGRSWQGLPAPEGVLRGLVSADGALLVATTDQGVSTSADGGTSWTHRLDWTAGRVSMLAEADGTLVVGGPYRYAPGADPAESQRFASGDGGVTWTELPRIPL